MKKLVCLKSQFIFTMLFILLISTGIMAQDSKSGLSKNQYEYGGSVGLLLPAEINFSDLNNDIRETSSLLIRGFIDKYIISNKFTVGIYLNFAYSNLEEIDEYIEPFWNGSEWYYETKEDITRHKASVIEVGTSFKTKFILSPEWFLKPGINVGYRKFFFHYEGACGLEIDDAHGLAINGSFEFQYHYSEKIILFVEAGFLTQPYGGKEDITYLDFGPILYITLGIAH